MADLVDFVLRIGGLTLGLRPSPTEMSQNPFCIPRAQLDGPVDVDLELVQVAVRPVHGKPPDFTSPNWRAWNRDDGGVDIELNWHGNPDHLYRFVELFGDGARGRFSCLGSAELGAPALDELLGYPTDEVLYLHLLARRQGVIAHALALADRGVGLIFAGASGAGKTTLSRRWLPEPDVVVLTDERCVMRVGTSEARVYGSPWAGEGQIARNDEAPLGAVFLLKQAPQDGWSRLPAAQAAGRLLACTFPPLWEPGLASAAVKVVDDLVRSVPCYELRFLREGSCVPLIRGQLAELTQR